MSHSELPDSVTTEQPAVTDASSQQESELLPVQEQSKKRQKQRWSWILFIIFLIGGGLSWRWWQTSRASNAPPTSGAAAGKPMATSVKLADVETGTVQESSVFIGTLEAPRSVTIKPQIEGRVNEILSREGGRVQQGQTIISLQSDDVQALLLQRKAALDQASANLAELKAGTRPEQIAQAKATLVQAQARLTDAQAGAQPQEIAQAQAQIESAKSDLDLAKSRAKRYEQLRQEGAVSQDQLEGYLKEQRSDEAALVVAQKRLEQLRKGRGSDISALSAAVEQQKQNLRQQENGPRIEEIASSRAQVAQAAAQLRAAQVQLQYTKVVAPFTGVVGNIPVKVGEYVSKGDQLTTLTKNDSFDLNLFIPLNRAKQLRLGLPVQLLDGKGKSIAMGRVSFISPNATADSQTVLAKATFANSNGQLLNRQSVQAKVIWDQRPGILIPVTAVSRLGGKTFVFVAQDASPSKPGMPSLTAQQKPVELGAIQGNSYQVLQGLSRSEKIIVTGLLNLTNGAPIMQAPEETGNQTDNKKPQS
ncbi:RND family efflux transporter MFP subunit [Calothrix sp. NIES-4071]|nr:RND family efflux transporter MFP subunit [Calothrix sp. NIES-4071]BAZ56593.1 RND family efflux transporter MFP subunit [Calothrix sp. NIES-4105]